MATRVGINGFGRIGRLVFRAAAGKNLEIVGINDLTDADDARPPAQVRLDPRPLPGRGRRPSTARSSWTVAAFRSSAERDPAALPWKKLGAKLVIESTGTSPIAPAPRSTSRPAPSA